LFGGLAKQSGAGVTAWLGGVFVVAALLAPFGTWYGAAVLHVDGVAVALDVGSCLVLARGGSSALAAALCVLSIWTKQTSVPLLLAQLIFLARTRGRNAAAAYGAWLVGFGVSLTGIFCVWFGAETLWHNLVVIPGRFEFEWNRAGGVFANFVLATFWVWPLAWIARRASKEKKETPEAESASLLLLTSVIMFPAGFLSALKYGGGENSLHSLTDAILGGAALAWSLAQSGTRRIAQAGLGVLVAGLLIALTIDLKRVVTFGHLTLPEPARAHQEAFEFARAHPGQAYFPWDTLATLMAERREYPFECGYADWLRAGAAPEHGKVRRVFPETLTFIVYHEKDQTKGEMLPLFPEFTRSYRSGPWLFYARQPQPVGAPAK
jgi:hypothetical protein